MTKLEKTIAILKRGYTTSLECANQGGVMSLSQRINLDLRRMAVGHGKQPWWPPRFDIAERWQVTKDRAEE